MQFERWKLEDGFMARKSGSHFVMLECKYALLAKQVLQVSISSRKNYCQYYLCKLDLKVWKSSTAIASTLWNLVIVFLITESVMFLFHLISISYALFFQLVSDVNNINAEPN